MSGPIEDNKILLKMKKRSVVPKVVTWTLGEPGPPETDEPMAMPITTFGGVVIGARLCASRPAPIVEDVSFQKGQKKKSFQFGS